MMGMALAGKWAEPGPESQPHIPETVEAEVVEPAEAGSQKWEMLWFRFFLLSFGPSVNVVGKRILSKDLGIVCFLDVARNLQWNSPI